MNGRERPTWPEYALILAKAVASRSEDPYAQVGAVVLRNDHSVCAVGYNGPPSGIEVNWADRDGRRPQMIHAEMNALRYMRPGEGQLIAVTLMPCKECLKNIASYGIKEIAFAEPYSNTEVYDETETWGIALSLGLNLYRLQQVQ